MGSNVPQCHSIWKLIDFSARITLPSDVDIFKLHQPTIRRSNQIQIEELFSFSVEKKKGSFLISFHPFDPHSKIRTCTHDLTVEILLKIKYETHSKEMTTTTTAKMTTTSNERKRKAKTIFSSFNEKMRNMRMACKTMCTYIEKGTEKRI